MSFRGRIRVGVPIGAAVLGLAAGDAPAAAGVRLTARFPSVATVGAAVRVPVRLAGSPRGVRVVLEQRRRGGWRVSGGGARGARRFSLRWRAPARAGVVKLRVVAVRSGRRVAATRVGPVAISATRVLAAGRVVEAPAPGGGGEVRYGGRVGVRAGQFVAADVGPQTPAGLLGRVVSSRFEGGETVLSIEPASLVEAVPAGRIALSPVAIAAHRVHAAARRRRFRSAFRCTGGVGAVLDGSLAVSVLPTFELDWSLHGIERALAKVTVRGEAQLSVGIGAAGSCALAETRVAAWDGPPLRLAIGPIPVVLVPRTVLSISGEATASAALAVGIHGRVSATAGLRYDGEPHAIGRFAHSLSYTPPGPRVTGSLGARVIPSVTFLIYGQAGPRFGLASGLQLDAVAGSSPWWTLTVPVELLAGIELPNLIDLTIPPLTVLIRSFPLAQAEPDPAAPEDAQAGAGRGVERAGISWDTAATDVDLHVWDEAGNHAWFRDPAGVPGGELSEDDRYGFGPEHFFDRAGGRALTFGLCYFDDTGAGPTSVAIRLTDPDGAVRHSTRTLAREGDHVLLGSSPPGRGFVPPEGWCKP